MNAIVTMAQIEGAEPVRSGPPVSSSAAPRLLGLTGLRRVGKSTVAGLLEQRGYARAHAFEGGKVAIEAYLARLTGSAELARRMVHGDLKDVPSPHLPGGAAPRLLLERAGRFWAEDLGVDWTLGAELARLRRMRPGAPIVVESLVYEAAWFRAQGGLVIRIIRPGHRSPEGTESDAVQASIRADATIVNDGDLDRLRVTTEAVLRSAGLPV